MTGRNKLKKTTARFNLRRLGTIIRQRRQDLDLSQEDLALMCRLHRTYISGIERGVRNPTITCIDGVARALELSIADLLTRCETRS
jgi:transcriptional regulator with XRE-family HTH domain